MREAEWIVLVSFITARTLRLVALIALLAAGASALRADPGVPASSEVVVVRAEQIMTQEGLLNPTWLFPDGRIDYRVIEWLLNQTVSAVTGEEDAMTAWKSLISPGDRVGIQIDVAGIQPHDPVLEALVRRIVDVGVPLRNIVIYSADETELFRAGYDISGTVPGATVMASDAVKYRDGISRVVLDHVTKIINLSRLRVDPEIGMHGALANYLAVVPYEERTRLRRNPDQLAAAAAIPTVRRSSILHIIHALEPAYAVSDSGRKYSVWQYNGLLASVDPVAVDTVAQGILRERISEELGAEAAASLQVPYLVAAAEQFRLGNTSPDCIEVVQIGP